MHSANTYSGDEGWSSNKKWFSSKYPQVLFALANVHKSTIRQKLNKNGVHPLHEERCCPANMCLGHIDEPKVY